MDSVERTSLGVFKVIVNRDFPLDRVKRVVVKLTRSEKVHITFVVDHEFSTLLNANKSVAIDVGVEKLLVTSDGEYFLNLRPLKRHCVG